MTRHKSHEVGQDSNSQHAPACTNKKPARAAAAAGREEEQLVQSIYGHGARDSAEELLEKMRSQEVERIAKKLDKMVQKKKTVSGRGVRASLKRLYPNTHLGFTSENAAEQQRRSSP